MDPREVMGLEIPGDEKVTIPARHWHALKLDVWRGKTGWNIVLREVSSVLEGCRHVDGCLGATVETEPCDVRCPDRERRMSALVILNAARMYSPVKAPGVNEPYFAPSREHFSEVVAALAAAESERDALMALVQSAGLAPPSPLLPTKTTETPALNAPRENA